MAALRALLLANKMKKRRAARKARRKIRRAAERASRRMARAFRNYQGTFGVTGRFANADAVAKALGGIASKKMQAEAVNAVGKELRRTLPREIAAVYGTSVAAVGARGQSARPGAAGVAYTLKLRRQLPFAKLKAAKRSYRRGLLTVDLPTGKERFRAIKGGGRGHFILPEREGLPERPVGGPILRRDMSVTRDLERMVDRIPERVAAELVRSIDRYLSR